MPELLKKGDYIEVTVTGLTIDPFTNMPIIILKDLEQKNALPIWIGLIEASAIAVELEKIQLSRPMAHDLISDILKKLGVQVKRVEISDLRDNTFYANIYLALGGREIVVDSRPSDAIAIAMRTKSRIFIAREVMEKSRKIDLSTEETASQDKKMKEKWAEILESLSPEDFGKYKM